MDIAASTFLPRMSATTRRAFCAVSRTKRLVARVSISGARSLPRGCARRSARRRTRCGRCARRRRRPFDLALAIARMAVERPRRRKLAELMPDGVLGDEHGDELPAVVDGEREADHVGDDRRAARPGLDDALLAAADHALHF